MNLFSETGNENAILIVSLIAHDRVLLYWCFSILESTFIGPDTFTSTPVYRDTAKEEMHNATS